MGIITSQQLTNFYTAYKEADVTFTKEVIRALGLNTKQVFLKCVGQQWPCVIYSCSMMGAKVIACLKDDFFKKVQTANNIVSLRFSFKLPDKADPIAFYASARIMGFNPYTKDNTSLNFLSLVFTQRPPDSLIEILGILLDTNANAKNRKEERIIITADSIRKLGLKSKEGVIFIDKVPRKGIIRDISFSGAKIIILGVGKFLADKDAILSLELEDHSRTMELKGKVYRYEPVEGRKELAVLIIIFNEETLPMEYKLKLNEYLSRSRISAPNQDQDE
ncbi:MAG: PilZ domain-containing protein [Spirochaetales bacterium]|nr:MAG: PilZ domain-containing protein [Spirochaetales bacterium]